MNTITINGKEIGYDGLEDKIQEIQKSIKELNALFKDTSELGMHKIFNELMNTYLSQNLSAYAIYDSGIRNNFIQSAVKALNALRDDEVFEDNYEVIYKKEQSIDKD